MAELIERDAALARIDCCLGNSLGGRKEFDSGLMQARKFVTSTPAVNRWIPCSKRMPEIFDYVIGAGSDGIGIVRYNGTFFVDDSGATYTLNAITHWMPLPEPPKEDN